MSQKILGEWRLSLERQWSQCSVKSWFYKARVHLVFEVAGIHLQPCKDGPYKVHTLSSQSCHWEISPWLVIGAVFPSSLIQLGELKLTHCCCVLWVHLFACLFTVDGSYYNTIQGWLTQLVHMILQQHGILRSLIQRIFFLSSFGEVLGGSQTTRAPKKRLISDKASRIQRTVQSGLYTEKWQQEAHFNFSLGICMWGLYKDLF